MSEAGEVAAKQAPLTAYQKKLFVFLSVATFFEGYDFIALTQVMPEVRSEFSLDEASAGFMVSVIKFGTVLAFLLVRRADRWGRRRVLTLTIAGYTLCTFLSGLAPSVFSFASFQLFAHMFLIAEWATSMVLAAEEFPAARRGMVIGVIQACSSLGSIVCAGIVPVLIDASPYGWRTVYFVGIVPLIILAFARRGLKESRRFAEQAEKGEPAKQSLLRIWKTGHVKRMLQLALIWGLTYLCTNNAITWWKEFAMTERGLTKEQVGLSISIAAVGALPLVFYSGKLLDVLGRKKGAVVIFIGAVVGLFFCYGLHGQWPLTIALTFGIFGASGVMPVLNAFTAELFPTELRGDAFAWANNLLGRIGYVLGPGLVGILAGTYGWGRAVQFTVVGPVLAVILILLWLPETNQMELEETAGL
jgi:putative MFS transporter